MNAPVIELARDVEAGPAPDSATDVACPTCESQGAPEAVHAEQRRLPRGQVERPVILVPVLPNGMPDWDHRYQGAVVDVNPAGVGLVVECEGELPAQEVVLAVPGADGTVRCAGLEVRHSRRIDAQRVHAGAQFGGFAEQLFRPENLTPTYQPQRGGFALGLPEELLSAWAAVGILQPRLVDRVAVCPECQGLPTYRQGCLNCGAAGAVTQDRLIHHFACAYVGAVNTFQDADDLRCPKCRTRQLCINSDYEYLTGHYRCGECHWSGDERVWVAQCLRCELRFPADQAVELELKGFHVDRLEPLALTPAS
jgi:hypothetical protein